MMEADEVIAVYTSLSDNAIRTWLVGGWGIDALLGEQVRPHKDLDLLVLLDDLVRMRQLLDRLGYHFKEPWSENRQVVDSRGMETATAFILHDSSGRELDIHALRLDGLGNGIPAWETEVGFIFTKEDLEATGRIAEVAVCCITPAKQMLCHRGYQLPEYQVQDLQLLHGKFMVDFPPEVSRQLSR